MAIYNYIKNSGVIIPDTSDTREIMAAAFKTPDAFGADFNTDSDTNQGKFVDLNTETLSSVAINNAQGANQINPNIAEGKFLDAIVGLQQYERLPATKSYVELVFTGVAGTVIPSQTQVRSTNNDIFVISETVTIGAGGTATSSAGSLQYGAIPVTANSVTQIPPASQRSGWDTVNNPLEGIKGSDVQTDSSLRSNYLNILGFNSKNTTQAVQAALTGRDDVFSAICWDNNTGEVIVQDTITFPVSSMWVGVVGSISDEDVASVIMDNKASGASFVGNVEVPYVAENGQESVVKFDRGEPIVILCRVYVISVSGMTDVQSAVSDAILNAAAGNVDGFSRWGLNYDISAFDIASAIHAQVQNIVISKVEITTSDAPTAYSTDPITIHVDQVAVIGSSGISVIITTP